ncbi:MAG: hypothetical protein ACMG6E_10420 [Candidatus Roizmanbacteria bacterium]
MNKETCYSSGMLNRLGSNAPPLYSKKRKFNEISSSQTDSNFNANNSMM